MKASAGASAGMHQAGGKPAEGYGLTTDRQDMTPAPVRIDVWRAAKALMITLVIPTSLAVFADLIGGTLPWLTIAAVIICIPLATIVVNRTVLAEFNRIVDLVAPEDDAEDLEQTAVPAVPSGFAEADSISNDWPLDDQPITEGAQKHHG